MIVDPGVLSFRFVGASTFSNCFIYAANARVDLTSSSIVCNSANDDGKMTWRFGDVDSAGNVFNGCRLTDLATGPSGFAGTPLAADIHFYSGAIRCTGTGPFWRVQYSNNDIVRFVGVQVDGNLGGRFTGANSIFKDWRVYNMQASTGPFNPKAPFGQISGISVVNSLQALYHFWPDSRTVAAEGFSVSGLSRLVRFANSDNTGEMLTVADVDIEVLQTLPALYVNDTATSAPGNTFRLSQYLTVTLPDALGVPITQEARVLVRDVTDATVVDTTTSTGAVARTALRYRDMNIAASGTYTWASAGGTTYAPYAVAFAAYGYLPSTVPLPLLVSQEVAMVALVDSNVTLSAAAAAALSGKFSIDGSGDITVTADATLDELYDYAAVWITQSAANLLATGMGHLLIEGAGSALEFARNIVVDAGATLTAGTKFTSFVTTGTVTNNGEIIGSYTDASGTRVTIRTSDDLPLSTYLTIDGVPQAWEVGATRRRIFVQPSSAVRIYAHAYGYQPRIVNVTGNTASDYVLTLARETNVDTTLDTTTRDTIAGALAIGVDAFSRLFLSVNADLRTFTPSQVMNALHYFTVTQGAMIAAASVQANSVDGFALQRGGFVIRSPGFYGKVAESVTVPTNLGILVPLAITVDPSVYLAVPTYTPVELNASGVPLQYAPWTQQEADVPAWVAKEVTAAKAVSNAALAAALSA